MTAGDRVVILAGRLAGVAGVVSWSGIDGSCGCRSVVVRTERGEWWGKVSEVAPAAEGLTKRTGGPLAGEGVVLVGDRGSERLS